MNRNQVRTFGMPISSFGITVAFAFLTILGIAAIPFLSIQLQPTDNPNNIHISFNWSSVSAEILEEEVTCKIEGVLSTVRGIKNIRSISSKGYGYVQVDLESGTEVDQTRYEIVTLIRQLYLNLPKGVSFPMVYVNRYSETGSKAILSYSISGKANVFVIQKYVEKIIKPQLALLEGVYEVNLYGANSHMWELNFDPNELINHGVTGRDIETAIITNFQEHDLGKVHISTSKPGSTEYIYVRLNTKGKDFFNWNKIPLKKIGTKMIYLTDLVTVKYSQQNPKSLYRTNGLNTINLELISLKKENNIFLADKVKKLMSDIESNLPKDYSILQVYDATYELKRQISKIIWRSLAALIILLLFVFIVSKSIRYLLVILISMVGNLLLAFIFYYVFKLDIHIYSLAGITISMGMIAGNSIVVIDHVLHKKNMQFYPAIVSIILSSIGVISIIFFLNDGQQVKLIDLAWVMIINLGVFLLISFFVIPTLIYNLGLSKTFVGMHRKKIIAWNKAYSRIISFGIRNRRRMIILAILSFGLPVFKLPAKIENEAAISKVYNSSIGSDFYNESMRPWVNIIFGGTLRLFFSSLEKHDYSNVSTDRTNLSIKISLPKGAMLEQINTVAADFEAYLSQFDEIERFQTRIYSGMQATIEILFKEEHEDGSFPHFLKSQVEIKALYTGMAEFGISGVGKGFNNEMTGIQRNYGLTLSGYNYQSLHKLAEQVKALLLKNPRVEKVNITSERDWNGQLSTDEYVFRVSDPQKVLLNGLSMRNIGDALNSFLGEKKTINYLPYQGVYVPVLLSPSKRPTSVWQVMNGPLGFDSGSYVRLREFATLEKEETKEDILRENQQYRLVVNYNFIGDHAM